MADIPANGVAAPSQPKWIIAPTVAAAAFMHVLDMSIVNVSLHHISGSLSATREETTWVLTSYLVTSAIALPASGWLSSVFGRKRYYLFCILGFGVTSLMCGMAQSLEMLVVSRALQGLMSGGLQPISQAIMADTYSPQERGKAMAMYGMAVVLAPAIGPTLGGIITDTLSWHWVFLINLPISLVLFVLCDALLTEPKHMIEAREARLAGGIKIDYIGFGLLMLGFGGLQIILDRGQQSDWFNSDFIAIGSVVVTLAIVGFIVWELTRRDPIIDLSLLRNRNFAISNLFLFMQGFVMLSTTALVPQFAQEMMGYSATDAGLILSPGGFVIMMTMPLVARILPYVDSRHLIAFAMAVASIAIYLQSTFTVDVDSWTLATNRMLQSFGLAFMFIPINSNAYIGLPPQKVNAASALLNLSRNLGGGFGIAITTTMLARQAQVHQATLVSHLTPYNQPYVDALATLEKRFMAEGPAGDALMRAHATIARELQRQALQLAYMDDFLMLSILFGMLVPVVYLMRPRFFTGRPPSSGEP